MEAVSDPNCVIWLQSFRNGRQEMNALNFKQLTILRKYLKNKNKPKTKKNQYTKISFPSKPFFGDGVTFKVQGTGI